MFALKLSLQRNGTLPEISRHCVNRFHVNNDTLIAGFHKLLFIFSAGSSIDNVIEKCFYQNGIRVLYI
jgi:hypothetical protein